MKPTSDAGALMGAAITLTFELAADRCEDLTPLVYERLFRAHPEMQQLFVLDSDDALKGSMLSWCIRAILDFVGERSFGPNLIETEAVNHVRNSVAARDFTIFFHTLADTMRDVLGNDWTPQMSAAWAELLTDLEATVAAVEPSNTGRDTRHDLAGPIASSAANTAP